MAVRSLIGRAQASNEWRFARPVAGNNPDIPYARSLESIFGCRLWCRPTFELGWPGFEPARSYLSTGSSYVHGRLLRLVSCVRIYIPCIATIASSHLIDEANVCVCTRGRGERSYSSLSVGRAHRPLVLLVMGAANAPVPARKMCSIDCKIAKSLFHMPHNYP